MPLYGSPEILEGASSTHSATQHGEIAVREPENHIPIYAGDTERFVPPEQIEAIYKTYDEALDVIFRDEDSQREFVKNLLGDEKEAKNPINTKELPPEELRFEQFCVQQSLALALCGVETAGGDLSAAELLPHEEVLAWFKINGSSYAGYCLRKIEVIDHHLARQGLGTPEEDGNLPTLEDIAEVFGMSVEKVHELYKQEHIGDNLFITPFEFGEPYARMLERDRKYMLARLEETLSMGRTIDETLEQQQNAMRINAANNVATSPLSVRIKKTAELRDQERTIRYWLYNTTLPSEDEGRNNHERELRCDRAHTQITRLREKRKSGAHAIYRSGVEELTRVAKSEAMGRGETVLSESQNYFFNTKTHTPTDAEIADLLSAKQ